VLRVAVALVALAIAAGGVSRAQQMPLAPRPATGGGVTPAFEGWYQNPDGTFTLLFGYLNRNHDEALDIPVGPDNRVEPGGPDRGQPTHFLPVALTDPREIGVFAVTVPKDFGSGKVTWTLTANGETNQVPGRLHPDYVITPFGEPAQGDTPPVLRFEPGGSTHAGPPQLISASFKTAVRVPVTLTLRATKTPPPRAVRRSGSSGPPVVPVVIVRWSKYRGPGPVTFGAVQPEVDKSSGQAVTTASFSVPGAYILRVRAMDASDRGSNQCCRTNALVGVTVTDH
jgi:hypothetical protein